MHDIPFDQAHCHANNMMECKNRNASLDANTSRDMTMTSCCSGSE